MPEFEPPFAFALSRTRPADTARSWRMPSRSADKEAVARAVVVDKHPLFRQAARDLLESSGGFRVLADAGSGREAVDLTLALNPDVLLLDMHLGDMDGIHALQYLREARVDTRVAIITASRDPADLQSALRAGVDGYLMKDAEPGALVKQLRRVVDGQLVLGDGLSESLARSLRADQACLAVEQAGLTAREREILQRIAAGCSNARIADELLIAESTVKVHVKHLLRKLGLHSRVEAALWCLNQGL